MPAANTDYFTKIADPGNATTLAAPGHSIGGTTINVDSTALMPTTTGIFFAIDSTTLVNGVETRTAGTYTVWEGTVASATSISNMVLKYGTDQNYAAGASTRVYVLPTAARENRLVDGLLVSHDQDGTHNDNSVGTSNLAAGCVTDAKISSLTTGVRNGNLNTEVGEIGGAWKTWTPTWGGLAGQPTANYISAKYTQLGKTVHFKIILTFLTDDLPNGSVTFTLPVAAANDYNSCYPIGQSYYAETGVGNNQGIVFCSSSAGVLMILNAASTYLKRDLLSSTVPHTWKNTDVIQVTGTYEAA